MKSKIIHLIFLILFISTSIIYSQIKTELKKIDDGILYKRIINIEDTLIINILQIDITNGDYILHSLKAGNTLRAREKTSDMVRLFNDSTYKIIAAINADFFEADGEVVNNMISAGDYIKAAKFSDKKFIPLTATQFAVTGEQKLLMEQFVFRGDLILKDGIVEDIVKINSYADSNSIVLYNFYEGNVTPSVPESWYNIEFKLESLKSNSDTLKFIIKELNKLGNIKISGNDFILAGNNRYAYYLERKVKEEDTVSVVLKMDPDYGKIYTLVGGWPRIVKDGKNVIRDKSLIEGISKSFSETRHPRTGVGFSKDSTVVYFITVDGRQKQSRGMSLNEFASLMIKEGIYQGLNLDGGGSTTMVINGEVVNNPSDSTGEREVANCLAVVKRVVSNE